MIVLEIYPNDTITYILENICLVLYKISLNNFNGNKNNFVSRLKVTTNVILQKLICLTTDLLWVSIPAASSWLGPATSFCDREFAAFVATLFWLLRSEWSRLAKEGSRFVIAEEGTGILVIRGAATVPVAIAHTRMGITVVTHSPGWYQYSSHPNGYHCSNALSRVVPVYLTPTRVSL